MDAPRRHRRLDDDTLELLRWGGNIVTLLGLGFLVGAYFALPTPVQIAVRDPAIGVYFVLACIGVVLVAAGLALAKWAAS